MARRKQNLPPIIIPKKERGTLNKLVGGPAADNLAKVRAIIKKPLTGAPGSAARATQVTNKRKALNFVNRLLPGIRAARKRKSLIK